MWDNFFTQLMAVVGSAIDAAQFLAPFAVKIIRIYVMTAMRYGLGNRLVTIHKPLSGYAERIILIWPCTNRASSLVEKAENLVYGWQCHIGYISTHVTYKCMQYNSDC